MSLGFGGHGLKLMPLKYFTHGNDKLVHGHLLIVRTLEGFFTLPFG